MGFKVINLAGDRAIVQGTDVFGTTGKAMVNAYEWSHLKNEERLQALTAEYDAKVKEFYAPLTAASQQLEAAKASVNTDPAFYIVKREKVTATSGQDEEIVMLDRDSVILRLIEQDVNTPRLIWVDEHTLDILAPDVDPSDVVAATSVDEVASA